MESAFAAFCLKTMKRAIFILMLALALFSCKSYKPASENPNYKPLEYFGTDTLAFYKYNFEEHKDFYIGKKFSVLINDMGYKSIADPNQEIVKQGEKYVVASRIYLEPFGVGLYSLKDFSEKVIVYYDEDSCLKLKDFYEFKRKKKEYKGEETALTDEMLYGDKYFFSDCVIKDIQVVRFDYRPFRHKIININQL